MIGYFTHGTNDVRRTVRFCGGCFRDPEGRELNVSFAG